MESLYFTILANIDIDNKDIIIKNYLFSKNTKSL